MSDPLPDQKKIAGFNWNRFSEPGSTHRAKVSIHKKSGTVSKLFFNDQAYQLLFPSSTFPNKPGGATPPRPCVILYHEPNKRLIGFFPTSMETEQGATLIESPTAGGLKQFFIPIANFLAANHIVIKKTIHMDLEYDNKNKLFYVELPRPGRRRKKS